MRLIPRSAPLLSIALAAVIMLISAPQSHAQMVKRGASVGAPQEFNLKVLRHLRAQLDEKDHLAALKALHIALSQLSDGATFVWRKKSRQLAGVIKPTMAFRNTEGQICRHVIYSLSLGRYVKSIEGIACRDTQGRWWLNG